MRNTVRDRRPDTGAAVSFGAAAGVSTGRRRAAVPQSQAPEQSEEFGFSAIGVVLDVLLRVIGRAVPARRRQ
jgi:hypothetical protein